MNSVVVVLVLICLMRSHTENIYLNPGDEYKYSIFTDDTLTLQCPVNSSLKGEVRWSYVEGAKESILSIGEKLNEQNKPDFRFSVKFTNHRKNVIFLRIYNITSKEPKIYRCYYPFANRTKEPIRYVYSIRLANVTNSLTSYPNGTILCELHGRNISALKFIWEQQTLYGQHIRFIESFQEDEPGTSKPHANLDMYQYWISWLHLGTNRISKYDREGEYICTAQISIHGRSQAINKTAYIKIENKPDRPFCFKDVRSQYSLLGTNLIIVMKFYSKPTYSAVSLRKNASELKLGNDIVNMKNISFDVYNVTAVVNRYRLIINITEFSKNDIGNYTVNINNEFGYCNCTVQLLFEDIQINRYPSGNVIEGQSVLFVCQSISRKTTNNYSWTKNGIILSNSSKIVLENITQDETGNYTCSMKNEQIYLTENDLLIINPLTCTGYLSDPNELLMRFLGVRNFFVPFVLLVVSLICHVFIHLYCKKLKKITFETDENDRSRERIEIADRDNGYHTINEDNLRIENTEIENQSEITLSIRESLDLTDTAAASEGNELQIEEDYVHPYCSVMPNTIEMHEYKSIGSGVNARDGSNEVLNRESRLYENLKF